MKRKFTNEEFIEKSKKIHGNDSYSYDKCEYINSHEYVELFCNKHQNYFKIKPYLHINSKQGCKKCGIEKRSKNRTLSTEEFIEKAVEIHGNKYNYDKVIYIHNKKKVKIWCNTHNEFFYQEPATHLKGSGCNKCGIETTTIKNTLTTEEFIEKAVEIHGDKYSYHEVEYVNNDTKVKIWCNTHNKFFNQTPTSHTNNKSGCPTCSNSEQLTKEKFIERAVEIHGNKYNYDKVIYKNIDENVEIYCKKHNIFFNQMAYTHIGPQKSGCPKCGKENMSKIMSFTNEDFIKRATEIHGDKYDYSNIEYINNHTKINIFCKKHNKFFKQIPYIHIGSQKSGCPLCRNSKGEEIIMKWLDNNNIIFEKQKSFPDCKNKIPLRFDFYLPMYNILIEFDGIQHYIPQYKFGGEDGLKKIQYNDNIKNQYCIKNNIQLIRIRYDENINEILNNILLKPT